MYRISDIYSKKHIYTCNIVLNIEGDWWTGQILYATKKSPFSTRIELYENNIILGFQMHFKSNNVSCSFSQKNRCTLYKIL